MRGLRRRTVVAPLFAFRAKAKRGRGALGGTRRVNASAFTKVPGSIGKFARRYFRGKKLAQFLAIAWTQQSFQAFFLCGVCCGVGC